MPDPHELHIVVMGSESVGKTSLIRNYWHRPFLENIPASIGSNNAYRNVVSSEGWKIHLTVTDIGGYEGFRHLSRIELKDANAVIICYDVTDKYSWERALRCLDDTLSEHVRVYFCGTKIDLVNEKCPKLVTIEQVKAFARHIRAKTIETSSKVPRSIDPLFKTIIDEYVNEIPEYRKWRKSFKGKIANLFHF